MRVRGRVERFRDELQIALAAITRADGIDADPARFLPTAYRDLDELEGFLEHLAREVYEPGLKGLLTRLLGEEALRAEIRRAPCSLPALGVGSDSGRSGSGRSGAGRSGAHHAYLGGLLEHTVAVATMALELCTLHPRLDRDLLLSAAIVHDLGKTREFTYGAEIERSREGQLLGHVELGLRLISNLRSGHARRGAQACARALRDAPPRRRRGRRAAVRLRRGPGAVSAEYARCSSEGRFRARDRPVAC